MQPFAGKQNFCIEKKIIKPDKHIGYKRTELQKS